jgi:hypothetical protein
VLIDEFSESFLDELDDIASRSTTNSLYVLIDGAFVPGLHRRFTAELGRQSVHLLFDGLPSVTEEVLDVSPFMFQYRPGNPVIRELLTTCSGLPMLSAIESAEPLGTLVERLSAWTIVASDGARFNFRFADTRRLPAILRTLSKEQLGAMAGTAPRWHYITRTAKWAANALPGASAAIGFRPQELDADQFAFLADEGEADALLANLKRSAHPFQGRPSEHYRCVAVVLEAATARGLDSIQINSLFQASGTARITDINSAEELAIRLRTGTWPRQDNREVMA